MPDNQSTDRDLIYAVARQLPPNGRWTESQRQRWLNALESAVDLAITVTPQPANHPPNS